MPKFKEYFNEKEELQGIELLKDLIKKSKNSDDFKKKIQNLGKVKTKSLGTPLSYINLYGSMVLQHGYKSLTDFYNKNK